MNQIDISRHIEIFSRDEFGAGRRIDVVGAGATGSRITLSLAKLGLENIHVWDFDKVEPHNIANQAYSADQIGKFKVDALAANVKAATGLGLTVHNQRVDGSQTLGDVVFLLTDTMSSRKEIWQKGIRMKLRTKLMIETRMGTDQGRVYTICPTSLREVRGWEATLGQDGPGEVSACGTSMSVGPTAEFLSGLAVWQLVRWQVQQSGKPGTLNHEILFFMREPTFICNRFD